MSRIIGLDFGTVRIGVAISDERHILARYLGILLNTSDFIQQFSKLIRKEGTCEKIVVGLPLKMNGKDSTMTQAARQFAQDLEDKLSIPVELWDERLTSALVERTLIDTGIRRKRRAELSDGLSAVIILQSYLDRKGFS